MVEKFLVKIAKQFFIIIKFFALAKNTLNYSTVQQSKARSTIQLFFKIKKTDF
jgi:hypothetical protein